MRKHKKLLFTGLALLASGGLYNVSAQDQEAPTPEQMAEMATETRQAVFTLLGYNLGAIVGMAQGAPFDAAIAERNATRISQLAPMIPELLFAMDTREYDVETEALDKIWDNQEDFATKAEELVAAAREFAGVAAGGDQRQTLGAVRALGGACANCHDNYRVDDD